MRSNGKESPERVKPCGSLSRSLKGTPEAKDQQEDSMSRCRGSRGMAEGTRAEKVTSSGQVRLSGQGAERDAGP